MVSTQGQASASEEARKRSEGLLATAHADLTAMREEADKKLRLQRRAQEERESATRELADKVDSMGRQVKQLQEQQAREKV